MLRVCTRYPSYQLRPVSRSKISYRSLVDDRDFLLSFFFRGLFFFREPWTGIDSRDREQSNQ